MKKRFYLHSITPLFLVVTRSIDCGRELRRALFFIGLLLPLFMVTCRQTEPTATPESAITATPTAAAVTPTTIAATPTVIREESPAVEWVLKAKLPEEPVTAGVFRLPAPDKPTVAEVRQLATQFGLPGEIYIQEPLTTYHLFGVTQTLSVSDVPGGAQTHIYYRPVSDDYDPANLLPFDQAAPVAAAFLTERGLLDFPYQVVPVPYYVVPAQYYSDYSVPQFLRLVEGRPVVASPELTVAVDTAGRVFSIAYFPLSPPIPLGEYPLLSAPEAWSRIQAGTIEAFYSNFYPAVPQAVEAPPTAWGRTYRVGQQVDLYGWITVYRPAEGDGPPRLEISTSIGIFWLQATEAELRAIAAHTQEIIHAWGTAVKDIPRPWALELTGWEVIPQAPEIPSLAGIAGTIQRADGQTLLLTDTGQTVLLPDAPADLPDGYSVRVTGWSIEPADRPYPVFEWECIERYEAGATVVAPDPGDLPAIRQAVITEVDLVYVYQSGAYTGATNSDGLELNLLLPAWRFTGMADAGDKIEFIVRAVAPELVQPK